MSDTLQIKDLVKKFGEKIAVNNVSISVKPGEIYTLIGPNGSGKTTLLNCVVGLLRPDSGKVLIRGVNIQEKPVVAKHLFSYISDNPTIYPYLTGMEFIRLSAKLHGLSTRDIEEKLSDLTTLFPIEDVLSTRTESYSRGNIEKTAFISGLISNPALLVIDEPIVGLDSDSVTIFGDALLEFCRKGGSVFMSTHTLAFAGKYADRVGIINKGLLVKELKMHSKIGLEEIYRENTQ